MPDIDTTEDGEICAQCNRLSCRYLQRISSRTPSGNGFRHSPYRKESSFSLYFTAPYELQYPIIRGSQLNSVKFIANKVQAWLNDHPIKTIYIDPGRPWQNGYIESFHSRFRDECLNREWLLNLREARVVTEDWRQHYNIERPHSRLGYLSPEEFIQTKILTP